MSKIFDYALTQVPNDVKRFIDNSIEIANQIHYILERQGKTQRDLANLLGKKESEISKWLRGSHNFTIKSLSKIESVLNEKIIITTNQSEAIESVLKEEIITTRQSEVVQDLQPSDYSPIIKKDFPTDFIEVIIDKKRKGNLKIEESLYAMAA
jgi:transcriptional regulator with XRE-family HTH domain